MPVVHSWQLPYIPRRLESTLDVRLDSLFKFMIYIVLGHFRGRRVVTDAADARVSGLLGGLGPAIPPNFSHDQTLMIRF